MDLKEKISKIENIYKTGYDLHYKFDNEGNLNSIFILDEDYKIIVSIYKDGDIFFDFDGQCNFDFINLLYEIKKVLHE